VICNKNMPSELEVSKNCSLYLAASPWQKNIEQVSKLQVSF
jgi:hypothetical protein